MQEMQYNERGYAFGNDTHIMGKSWLSEVEMVKKNLCPLFVLITIDKKLA